MFKNSFVHNYTIRFILASLFFRTSIVCANNLYYSHVVIKRETLSNILYKKKLFPIYGKSGYLAQVRALNPQIGNRYIIYPGQNLVLPKIENQIYSPFPPIPQPSPEIKNLKNKIRSSHSLLDFSLSNRFVKIKSNDFRNGSRATLLSDSGIGYSISWGQKWSDKLNTYFNFENYQVQILDSSTPDKSLSNTTQSLTSYTFGVSQVLNAKTMLYLSLNYGESIVYRAERSDLIEIEKFVSAKLNPGFNYTFLSRDELKLYSLINFILALPSTQETYSSKFSYGHKLGIGIEDRVAIFKIKGELFYNNLELKLTDSSFEQTETGVYFGVSYQFSEK
jgi:hypothetical protein